MYKTPEMTEGTHKCNAKAGDIQLGVYTLYYVNECGSDCEKEFEALSDYQAIQTATNMCKGNQDLWFFITLTDTMGDELKFDPFNN